MWQRNRNLTRPPDPLDGPDQLQFIEESLKEQSITNYNNRWGSVSCIGGTDTTHLGDYVYRMLVWEMFCFSTVCFVFLPYVLRHRCFTQLTKMISFVVAAECLLCSLAQSVTFLRHEGSTGFLKSSPNTDGRARLIIIARAQYVCKMDDRDGGAKRDYSLLDETRKYFACHKRCGTESHKGPFINYVH